MWFGLPWLWKGVDPYEPSYLNDYNYVFHPDKSPKKSVKIANLWDVPENAIVS